MNILVFLVLLSCFKRDLGNVNKVFSLDILEKLAKEDIEIEDREFLKSLGLEEALSSLSKLLLTQVLGTSELSRKSPSLIYRAILEKQLDIFKSEFKEDVDLKDQEILTLCFLTLAIGEEDIFSYVIDKAEDKEKRIEEVFKAKDKSGRTLLHFAFLAQNSVLSSEILEVLSIEEKEVFLKAKDKNGLTCFHYLALSGILEKYRKERMDSLENTLLSLMEIKGSETEFLDEIGKIVLNIGTIEMLKRVMYEKDNRGLTLLHYAAYFGNIKLCKAILSFGVDENVLANIRSEEIESIGRITPLEIAYLSVELEVIRYFEEGVIKIGNEKRIKDFFATTEGSKITFECMIKNRKKEVISYYLSKNRYDFKQKLEDGKGTILHILIENDMGSDALTFLSELEYLEEEKRGEFLKHIDENGEEALYLAVDRIFKEITHKILDLHSARARCARLGFQDGIDFTLLDKAIFKNNMESLLFVLELRRRYESEQIDDFTGKFNGKLAQSLEKICELVISRKEDKIKEDNKSDEKSTFLSFLEACLKNKGIEKAINVEEFLINMSQEDREEALLIASSLGDEKILTYLISLGVDSNKVYENGETAVMYAGYYGKKEALNVLLYNGGNVNHFTPNGWQSGRTVLMCAIENKHKEVVEVLLDKEAKVDVVDKFGRTSLLLASQNGHKEVVELLLTKGAAIDLAMNDGATPLILAGHKEVVELLLTKGSSVDLADENGKTPLIIASQNGHKEVVELLLSKGSSVDLTDKDGATSLLIASFEGHNEVVELLLNKGAKIDLADKNGWTPLLIASFKGHKEVVELLLSKGIFIDLADENGWTPLLIASFEGHKEVVELLLSKGIFIDLADGNGETPLMIASKGGHKEVVGLLIEKGASIDLANKNGMTSLYIASQNGHKEVVELLLTKGSSIDLAAKDGATPLMIASKGRHQEVVGLLIEKGASIDLANKNGVISLFIASQNGHKEEVELLLSKGFFIDLADENGKTPLMIASKGGHKEVVELLLSKGAAIDLADENGKTALYIASQEGHKEVVELLLTKGASIDLADKEYGETPLYIASENRHKEVVELLIDKGALIDLANKYGWTPLIKASQEGKKEVVELLLKKGAAIDLAKNAKWTPLWIASEYGCKEVVELLLEKGAAIDLAINNGCTPLYIASQEGHKKVVELLLSKGADVNKRDNSEETALFCASYKNHVEIVEILLNNKVDLNQISKDQWTALMWACYQGHSEIVKLLIERRANFIVIANDWNELMIAVDNGHLEAAKVLIESNYELNKQDKAGWSVLMRAALNNQEGVVELLVKKGVNVNLSNKDGFNALMIVSFFGYREIVQMLFDKGVEIDKVSNDGYTALELAKSNGKDEIVKLLQEKGAREEIGKKVNKNALEDISLKMRDSSFSLEAFVLKNEHDIKKYKILADALPFTYLKDNFFDIPKLNQYKYNGLHFAVLQQKTDNLKKLLLDDNIKTFVNSYDNEEKETCLGLAVKLNKLEHVKVLLSFLSSPKYFQYSYSNKYNVRNVIIYNMYEIKEYVKNKMLFEVLKEGRSEDASKLLFGHVKSDSKLEVEINDFDYTDIINLQALDEEGRNVFHYLAMYAFNEDDIHHFMNRRAFVETYSENLLFAYDNLGNTPFHYALLNSNEFFVKYFLVNGLIKKEDSVKRKRTRDGSNISSLINNKTLSKEIVDLFIEYVWPNEDDDIYNLLGDRKNKQDKCQIVKEKIEDKEIKIFDETEKNLVYAILKSDDEKSLRYILETQRFREEFLRQIIKESVLLNAYKCFGTIFDILSLEKDTNNKGGLITLELIFQACKDNKLEILEILVKGNEEKLIEQDVKGNTALHIACKENNQKIVERRILERLLKYEIVRKNINKQNDLGNTAMHNAHLSSAPHAISILKEHGADMGIKNQNGKRALDLLKGKDVRSQEYNVRLGTMYASLCAQQNMEYDPSNYEEVLHLAIKSKEAWIINELCTSGLINKQDRNRDTALHIAVEQDQKDMVGMLLKRGASFLLRKNKRVEVRGTMETVQEMQEETALELVRSKEVLMLIIERAISNNGVTAEYLLNMQNIEGNTVLHLVVERVKMKKLEVEVESKSGEVVVEEIEEKDRELIKAILDNGADKEKENNEGETVMNIGNIKVREFIKDYQPNLKEMRAREARYWLKKEDEDRRRRRDEQEENSVRDIINGRRGIEDSLGTGSNKKAIHLVASRNDDISLIILLDKGADPFEKDSEGRNCFEIAALAGNIDVFKVLVKRSDIFRESEKYGSAIYLSIDRESRFFEAIFERLKEECSKGYDINKLRGLIKDPVDRIIEEDNEKMLEKLINLGLKIVEGKNNFVLEALSKNKKKIFRYLINELRDKKEREKAIENWQDVIADRSIEEFEILVKEDIFKESESGISAVKLGLERKGIFFKTMFERLQEYKDKIKWYKLRESVKKLVKQNDLDILIKLLDLGLGIVDKDENNLIIESIVEEKKEIFDYLMSKIEKEEILTGKYKGNSATKESARKVDKHYFKAIHEKLEKIKEDKLFKLGKNNHIS